MDELGKLGKTWWAFLLVFVVTSALFGFTDKVSVDIWVEMTTWTFMAAAGKSAAAKIANGIGGNK